jgi:hypothetical protein
MDRPTPAAFLQRLPELGIDIDEDDNPLVELRKVELFRSILTIAGIDHASEITAVQRAVRAFQQGSNP